MAANGVERQPGGVVSDEHHVTGNADPHPFSNGNPFLADFDNSSLVGPSDIIQTGSSNAPELPVQSEVLIDFEGPETKTEKRSVTGMGPETQAVFHADVRLLDDFDPLQRTSNNGANVVNMAAVAEPEIVASTDLLGMMDPHGGSGFVEVYAVPPPGRPEEEKAEPEAITKSPEMTSPPEVKSPPPEVTSPQDMASPQEVAQNDFHAKATGKDRGGNTAGSGTSRVGGSGSKTVPGAGKTTGGGGGKCAEHVEASADRKAKASPRPAGPVHEGVGGRPVAAAGGGGGGAKLKDGATKTAEVSSAKSKTTTAAIKTPKAAAPSAESPRKTRSGTNKGNTEGDRTSVSISKMDTQRSVDSASMKPRTPTSADQPALKSPSPVSTPRSSVSTSGDGKTPDAKSAKSKIGSFDNTKHTPGGGNVKIPTQKIDVSNVTSRCGSKANITYVPGGGQKKIESRKLEWRVESRVGSLDNAKHKPGGGEKKIESKKLEWKVEPKVGSLENAQHKPGGGEKKIETVKLDFKEKAQPKIGSKENMDHKPGGGTKKIDNQNNLDSNETSETASAIDRIEPVAETAEEGSAKN